MRYLLSLFSIIVITLVTATVVYAQNTNGCQPIFGGGKSCEQEGNLLLDKKLRTPGATTWVDQANITDPKYGPDQAVVFQISVRNTSNRAIDNITVTDVFPQFVRFTRGPGTFDASTNTLTVPIKRIEAEKTTNLVIEGQVGTAVSLPSNPALCVVNVATAKQGRNTSTDNTQFCIQTPGIQPSAQAAPNSANPNQPQPSQPLVLQSPNVATSPKTGPELLSLIGLLPAGLGGMYLRKKTASK